MPRRGLRDCDRPRCGVAAVAVRAGERVRRLLDRVGSRKVECGLRLLLRLRVGVRVRAGDRVCSARVASTAAAAPRDEERRRSFDGVRRVRAGLVRGRLDSVDDSRSEPRSLSRLATSKSEGDINPARHG